MPDTTARLSLPFIAPAQAQKHVTHNEALVLLDAVVQLAVAERRAGPPSVLSEGARYIVTASPTGAFAGHAHDVAAVQDGAWLFFAPTEGWIAWVAGEAAAMVFRAGAWADLKPRAADALGIATEPDPVNRLAVSAGGVLFTHDGDDCRIKINKAAVADTASLLFQTAWSGRAEMGLSGDDKFHVKVSPDGIAWSEVLVADPATGNLGIGTAQPVSRVELQGTTVPNAQIKIRTEATSANFGGGLVLHHNNAAGGLPLANDRLGYTLFGTTISGASFQGGGIAARAEADFSSTSLPTYFTFETAPVGATSRSERLRITAGGNIGIGTAMPTVKLDVDGPIRCKNYTATGLPAASLGAGQIVMVSNEIGGAVLAFSDGANWRRVTDRAVVS